MSNVTILTPVVEVVTTFEDSPTVVEVTREMVLVTEIAAQGPAGPPGTGGGGGGEEVPTFPVTFPVSNPSVAAGASANFDSTAIPNNKTGKLQQVTLSSTAAYKWEIKTRKNGVDLPIDVVLTTGNAGENPTHEWRPPHKDYAPLIGDGAAVFRVVGTNLDGRNPAAGYVTFYWDEVTS